MNAVEAGDLFRLLSWIFGTAPSGEEPVNDAEAMESAAVLADRAHQALGTGPDGQGVRALWCQVKPVITVDRVPHDSGGVLPSGLRLVRNTTGQPEPVRLDGRDG
ncbi:hypothetical protein [Streptosporangium carneum]|uniref:Uncharacterized protein n=1 Tax=Streptosporangium carneum TaxID=47481 RepID=A0A9W6MAR9_9ACTN|nr:hypothetical protein [Streptosporangium carneum]GLK07287.1 hypothetical protein GCM10017600_06920 [Streptosporangium carneum]